MPALCPDPKWLRPKLFRAATVRDWFFDRSLGIVREFPKESTIDSRII